MVISCAPEGLSDPPPHVSPVHWLKREYRLKFPISAIHPLRLMVLGNQTTDREYGNQTTDREYAPIFQVKIAYNITIYNVNKGRYKY